MNHFIIERVYTGTRPILRLDKNVQCTRAQAQKGRGERAIMNDHIDANEPSNGLRIIEKIVKINQIAHIMDILNLILKQQMENALSNTVIAYKILLTLGSQCGIRRAIDLQVENNKKIICVTKSGRGTF